MSLEDSFRQHGVKAIRVDMDVVLDAVKAAVDTLKAGNQRTVVAVAVACCIVQMHSDIAGVTVDETIELMQSWLKSGMIPSHRI